jgi:cytoskeletal protein CcmA (bactofilin family)
LRAAVGDGYGRGAMLRGLASLTVVVAAVALAVPATAVGARDQVVITGSAVVGPRQTVGDVVVVHGPVTIRGRVKGDVVAADGRVRILGGRVTGDVTDFSDRIVLSRGARVGGDLNYGDERPVVAPGAVVGGDTKKFDVGDAFPLSGFAVLLAVWLAVSVSSLLLGLVLLAFAPRAADAAEVVGRDAPGPSIGWGVLLVFGLPILAVLALVTVIGIPLGAGLLLALVPIYGVGYVSGAWLLGRRILRPTTGRFVAFLVGWGILRLVALIPVAGGLGWLAATVFGLGALIVAAWRARRASPSAPAAPATAT